MSNEQLAISNLQSPNLQSPNPRLLITGYPLIISGIFIGLAHLARADGLLLLIAIILTLLLPLFFPKMPPAPPPTPQ